MRRVATVLLAMLACSTVGCVERRIHITSEPPGARVWLNDEEVGRTPVEVDFTYFGVYDVRLTLDGHEPIVTTADADAPIHEWPGIDLVALMIPVTKRTDIRWHYEFEPADNDPRALLERARALRDAEEALLGEAGDGAGDEPEAIEPE